MSCGRRIPRDYRTDEFAEQQGKPDGEEEEENCDSDGDEYGDVEAANYGEAN